MANIAMESFQTVENPTDLYLFRNFARASSTFYEGGRDGHKIAGISSTGSGVSPLAVADSGGIYSGFRCYINEMEGRYTDSLEVCFVSGNESIAAIFNTAGNISLPDGTTIDIGENAFIEIGIDEDYFELRIDAHTYYRQENTLTYPITFGLYPEGNNSSRYCTLPMLDFYINDSSGAVNNSFLGDVKIDAYPINADGSLSDGFSSGSGGALWQAVKDFPVNISDWVEASAIGSQVSFELANTEVDKDEVPLSVKTVAWASKMAGTDSGIKLLMKEGDTIVKTDKQTLPVQGIKALDMIQNYSPSGSVWSVNSVNNLEIGVEVVE